MYRFLLFGRFEAHWEDTPLKGFEPKKVQALFCYLATYRNRTHAREVLADVLWEGCDATATKKAMRQTLWQLQSALNTASDTAPVVLVDGEYLWLNPDADLVIDVAEFEAAARAVQDVSGYNLNETQATMLRDAVAKHRAQYLEGWYFDWCLYERERFQNLLLMMLDKLICFYEGLQEYETAIQFCNRALREEHLRECSHRQLMRLYYLMGDRTAALRQFERCQAGLQEALSVKPSHRTIQLYECICRDDAAAILLETPNLTPTPEMDARQLEIISHLLELKTVLDGVQWQVLRRLTQESS